MTADIQQLQRLAHLRGNTPEYSKNCLTIRTKAGTFVPFIFNTAQQLAHDRFERQLKLTTRVRALILKGRQQGLSTYIAARYYKRATMFRGVNVFILAHEQTASDTLFGIVDRYQRNNPLAPHVGVSNTKELEFDRLDSSYAVATAGSKGVGRSKTTSLFHGSEVAFWQNAKDHFSASVQTVPLEPFTEVVLESTSAGPSGEFYERFNDALAERGDEGYEAIFIPWYLSPEYSMPVGPDFLLRDDDGVDGDLSEAEYAALFNLSLEQMAWRRWKIREFRDAALFKREYPASIDEAWTAPSDDQRFIPASWFTRARKNTRKRGYGPLIIGVDPASGGGDRFAIAARRGMCIEWVKYRNKIDILEAFSWVRTIIDENDPSRVYIDAGNIGADLITMLRAAGPRYMKVVRGVNFGAKSESKHAKPLVPGPVNRRAEMYGRSKDWLMSPEGASVPDEDILASDALAARLKPQLNNDFLIESKKDMRSRGIRSPDLWDACILTFASVEYIDAWTQPKDAINYGNVDDAENRAREAIVGEQPGALLPIGQHGWMA